MTAYLNRQKVLTQIDIEITDAKRTSRHAVVRSLTDLRGRVERIVPLGGWR